MNVGPDPPVADGCGAEPIGDLGGCDAGHSGRAIPAGFRLQVWG